MRKTATAYFPGQGDSNRSSRRPKGGKGAKVCACALAQNTISFLAQRAMK